MPEIQVIFPAPDSREIMTQARVLTATLVASQHDPINWVFYNCDKRIEFVEVEFSDIRHKFFVTKKNRKPVRTHKLGKKVQGTGHLYGEVPDLGGNRPVLAKYTVRGWNAAMTRCYSELDPEILVNEP
jgi:hypothetical protein